MSDAVLPSAGTYRDPFGVSTSVRRAPVSFRSSYYEIREAVIANVDPLPSANDNLLFVRGICNGLIKVAQTRLLPVVGHYWKFATRFAPRRAKQAFGDLAIPASVGLLVLFEGTILWSLGAVAVAAQNASAPTLTYLMVAVAAH